MDRDDLLWLAGLIEGEGCLDLQRDTYPRIRVAMTDRDTVERVAHLIGSTVRVTFSRVNQPIWSAEKQGPRAAEIMELILPYMGARRSQQIATVLGRHRAREANYTGSMSWSSGLNLNPSA